MASDFILPPELAPSVNLTSRFHQEGRKPSPYDGEEQYEAFFESLKKSLYRDQPRHSLLIAERGVGQNSILSEFARRVSLGRIPFLRRKQIISINCRYIPEDESQARLDAIMSHVAVQEDLIVCMEGFCSLLRGERMNNHRSRLLWAVSQIGCRVIALVTPHEFEEFFVHDVDMMEFFTPLKLEEPGVETSVKLLRHFAEGLEQKYCLRIEESAIEQAVCLSHHYILNDCLPYKALKILHQECEEIRYEQEEQISSRNQITDKDVIKRISVMTSIPESTLSGVGEATDYRANFHQFIAGQEHVIGVLAEELSLIKAGLRDFKKPASVMMFVGQTGTGKTEVAKVLAQFYSASKTLKTFTLGNFVEPHSVSGIIGVPAGYVGHDHGGRLINELNTDPYSVFLLDEADKAHPDVMQPFLNLFDEGWVTDQRGTKAYADKAIFILTTNVGQRQIAEMQKEGKSIEEITTKLKESLSQIRHSKSNRPVFTPEFLARIKHFVVFQNLDHEAMQGIAQRQVEQLKEQWSSRRQKGLIVEDVVIFKIAEEAHRLNEQSQGKEGGRIVRKLIAQWLESALQKKISHDPESYHSAKNISIVWSNSTNAVECRLD